MDRDKFKHITVYYLFPLALIVIALLAVFFEDYSIEIIELEPISVIENDQTNVDPQALKNHSKISINGNEQFQQTVQAEGWLGEGTQENPFIIERYRIIGIKGDDSGLGESLIDLRNIDLYFVINNCILYSGWHGVFLENIRHGIISNTLAFNNSIGFFIKASFSNTLINNTAYKNRGVGFYLLNSEKNTLISNKASNNGRDGYVKPCNLYENTYENNLDVNNNVRPERTPIILYIAYLIGFTLIGSSVVVFIYIIINPKERENLKEYLILFRDGLLNHIAVYVILFGILIISIFFFNEEIIELVKRIICR